MAKLRDIERTIEISLFTLMGLFIFAVLFVSAIYWIPPLQRWVIQQAINIAGLPIHIDYDQLQFGSNFLEVDNLLIYSRADGIEYLVRADSLRTQFDIGVRVLHRVRLYRPRINIKLAPEHKGETRSFPTFDLPDIQVDSLSIVEGELDIYDSDNSKKFSARRLSYEGSLVSVGKRVTIKPDSLGVFLPDRGRINKANGEVVLCDNITLDLDIRLARSEFSGEGTFSSLNPLAWQFKAGGPNVDLVEIDSLLGLGFLLGSGHAEIDLAGLTTGSPKEDTVAGYVFIDGTIFDIPAGNASAKLHFKNNHLHLTELRGSAWGARVNAELVMDFPEEADSAPIDIAIEGYMNGLDLNALVPEEELPSNLSGRASIVGQLIDTLAFLNITGNLDPGSIYGINFDAVQGSIYVAPDSILFYPGFEVMRGGNLLDMMGTIVFYKEIYLQFGVWAPDLSKITDIVQMDDIISGRARLENGEILGAAENPIVSVEIVSDSLVTSFIEHKRFRAEATIRDIATVPRGDIFVESEGALGGLPYDSLLTNIEIYGNRYYVKPFLLWGDSLAAKGIAEIYTEGESTGIQAEGLELTLFRKFVSLESTFTVSIVGDTVTSTPLYARTLDGLLIVHNLRGDKEYLSLNASIESLQVAGLKDLLPSAEASGKLFGNLALTIPYNKKGPMGTFTMHFDSLTISGLDWDRADVQGDIRDGVVSVWPMVMSRGTEKYMLQGWVDPMDTLLPFSFEVTGSGKRLDAIAALTEEIDSIVGPFSMTFSFCGSKDSLYTDGKLDWNKGVVGARSLADPVEDITLKMDLAGDYLIIDTLGGLIGALPVGSNSLWARIKRLFTREKKIYGSFSATGSMNISNPTNPEMDLAFKAANLPLNFPEEGIFVRADADLALEGRMPVAVTGEVEIDQANIVKLETDGGDGIDTLPVELNILLKLPRNIWVLTDILEAEIGGEMNILTEQNALALYGELEVIRGKAFFYGRTFRIREGQVFFESIERINPRLNICATSKVGNVDIILNITGNLESPQIALSTEDYKTGERLDYTERDILSLLALNVSLEDESEVGYENVLQERLPQVVKNYIKREVESVARTTLGVETFEFEPSEENAFDLSEANITIGKYLTDRLYLRYTRSLGTEEASSADIINLEYRLTDHIFLEGSREASVEEGQEGESYNLNLKFKWEY